MRRKNRISENIEMAITFSLLFVGCILGKLSMIHFGESMLTFNISAIGTIIVGKLFFRGLNYLLNCLSNKQISYNLEIKNESDSVG